MSNNISNDKKYTQREFAKLVGKTAQTLVRWDKTGILVAKRTLAGRPYYTDEDVKYVKENCI